MSITLWLTRRTTVLWPFVWANPREPVAEETFAHSHLFWSSTILYRLPPSTTIHSILPVQFMCLTVFLTAFWLAITKNSIDGLDGSTHTRAKVCYLVCGLETNATVCIHRMNRVNFWIEMILPVAAVLYSFLWLLVVVRYRTRLIITLNLVPLHPGDLHCMCDSVYRQFANWYVASLTCSTILSVLLW